MMISNSKFHRARARFVAADETDTGSHHLVYPQLIVGKRLVTTHLPVDDDEVKVLHGGQCDWASKKSRISFQAQLNSYSWPIAALQSSTLGHPAPAEPPDQPCALPSQ
jgi:hypothetical protein